jgi:hypothetical protein
MTDKVFKQSGLPIRRSVDFLPSIFKTEANAKFLGGVFDPLIQPGVLEKLYGFIGRRYGKTYTSEDVYLDTDETLRSRYQLEPAVVTLKNNAVTDFYDYLDFKNQIKFFANNFERDDLITNEELYTWDPPINWDMFVNFREYYWMPNGPQTVPVAGIAQTIDSTYRVRTAEIGDQSGWLFFPDGQTYNPYIELYRGQTYKFEINSPRNTFSIRTTNSIELVAGRYNPDMFYRAGEVVEYNEKLWKALVDIKGDGSTINELSQDWELTTLEQVNYYTKGIENNGIQVGTLTFTVPVDAPDRLFYISEEEPLRSGVFLIKDIDQNSFIDIEKEILQKSNYTSSNNVKFTTGLVVSFTGTVVPEKYSRGRWLVEGVGKSISLINFDELSPPVLRTDNVEVLFDNEGFDSLPFDEATSFPDQKDYIVSNRASIDLNPWSRSNRWFHRDVISYAATIGGGVMDSAEATRAKRPILEFVSNVQLFNHGARAKQAVDFIDDFTRDVFSTIEGTAGYNVDGNNLFNGARILFTADTDLSVNGKIYEVRFITTQYSGNTGQQISLVETSDSVSVAGDCVLVKKGSKYRGKMFHFNGTTWVRSQEKTAINQPPFYDTFDSDGVSFSDTAKYAVSSFVGTKIISYKSGNGPVDKETGIALSYLNIDNIGDVLFEANWDVDKFTYQNSVVLSQKINTGFLKFNSETDSEYNNTWTKANRDFLQPIIDSVVLTEETESVSFDSVFWRTASREKIIFYKNGSLFKDQYQRSGIRNQTFIFDKPFSKGDVVSIKVYTDAEPDQGYYEIPSGLEKNPLNQDLNDFSYGQILDHLGSMVELDNNFKGQYPGNSNIRDLTGFQQFGRRLVKHEGSAPLALTLLCNKDINVIKAVDYASSEYQQFKNSFLTIALTLDIDLNLVNFVDSIINEMSRIKNADFAFADSDMIGSGSYQSIRYVVEDQITVFALGEKFDLSKLSRKAVYVYKNNQQLMIGKDYSFNSTFGFLTLLIEIADGDIIEIREYNSTAFGFIPPTPTKLGLYKKYTPAIFVDNTYITPTKVIRGHDGSVMVAYNDYRDDILLELEKRIYNNIKVEYDPAKFDIDSVMGGYYDTGIFSKQQVDQILEPYFLKWITNSNVDYVNNTYYDSENSFTYTYSNMTDISLEKNLLGWWRGIYQWFYDTDAPHVRPWEMLGFSEMPTWWEEEYGPAPYTSGNLILWEDLRDGVIKQGPRKGKHARYSRPSLLSHLPVNQDGKLLSPLESNLAQQFTLINASSNFKFGDISPAESAWRKSAAYPYAVISAMCLLRPFEFISKAFDISRIRKNQLDQTVYGTGIFLKLNELIFPAVDGNQTSGLVNYLYDYVKGKDTSTSVIAEKITNIDVRLSNKIGGFVDAAQQKYVLDSKNPKSTSSGVFIPPENYEIIFNVGTPFLQINYSGIIIEKVNTGWKLSGYDNKNPYFNYYEPLETKSDPLISVGGVTDTFLTWESGKQYSIGQVVRLGDRYFRVIRGHTSGARFDPDQFRQLPKLEQIGAVEVLRRQVFNTVSLSKLPYSTILPTIQAVADFIFGYEQYLLSLGIVFDEYNYDTQTVNNWVTSIKEFMFWTKHNWAEGQLITLSPAAYKLHINYSLGVVDSLLDTFYEYSIFNRGGTVLAPSFINVNRDYQQFTITVTDDTPDGIYFASINFVLKEHVVIFDDRTVFNDVLYDKTSGYRQDRIKVIGYRTTDWDGDYTSPGFMFDNVNIQNWQSFTDYNLGDIVSYREFYWTSQTKQDAAETFDETRWSKLDNIPTKGLMPNFDYRINQFEDYFDLDSEGVGSSQRDLARHTIGYQEREYLKNLSEDPVSQFKIYQGFIREKGTLNSITKVFDKLSRTDKDSITLKEEWAFRIGQYGGSDQFTEVEFPIIKGNFRSSPQTLLINNTAEVTDVPDLFYRILSTDFTIKPLPLTNEITPVKYFDAYNRSAGYVRIDQVDFIVKSTDDISTLDISNVKYGNHVWITFVEPTQWNVFRYTRDSLFVENVRRDLTNRDVVITCSTRPQYMPSDIVGITGIASLTGFFKVKSVSNYDLILDTFPSADPLFEDSSNIGIGRFVSCRFETAKDISKYEIAKLKKGDKLFIDRDENRRWEVLEKTDAIFKHRKIVEFGFTQPGRTGISVLHLEKRGQTLAALPDSNAVVVYKDDFVDGLRNTQTLFAPDAFETNLLTKFGFTLEATPDENWLFVGSPFTSGIGSRYQGIYNPTASYSQNDIVIFAGKLWRAKINVNGDGSSINIYSQDWEVAKNIPADDFINFYNPTKTYRPGDIVKFSVFSYMAIQQTRGNLPTNPAFWAITTAGDAGHIRQGMVTIYQWKNDQWTEETSIVSPRPQPNELFGSSITSGYDDGKYYLAISSPGANNSTGAVYLYTLNGDQWELIEDSNYLGIYEPARFYPVNSIVWFENKLWKALADNDGDGSTITVNSADWIEMEDTITQSSLPTSAAIISDGTMSEVGTLPNGNIFRMPEMVKAGDEFGYSISFSKNADTLVVGSPNGDDKMFVGYKGVWKSFQTYISGDVVKYESEYYRYSGSASFNDIPSTSVGWTLIDTSRFDSANKRFGKIFIYKKNEIGVYQLYQTVSNQTISSITDIGLEVMEAGDKFGFSVDIDDLGETIVASAPYGNVNLVDNGYVYAFKLSPQENVYRLTSKFEGTQSSNFQLFGNTIKISGNADKIVVGARNSITKLRERFDGNRTTFDDNSTTYYTERGSTGKVYVFEQQDTEYFLSEELDAEFVADEGFGIAIDVKSNIIVVGSPEYGETTFIANQLNQNKTGQVRKFFRNESDVIWKNIGVQPQQTDIGLLKSIGLYDSVKNIKIADIDIVDHFKYKFLGVVEQEIKFKNPYDPAIYSSGTEDVIVDPSRTWYNINVGRVWFNLKKVKWVNAEQDSIAYRSGHWNELAQGSVIDVCEWVETTLLPEDWSAIADTPEGLTNNISGQPLYTTGNLYNTKEIFDEITGTVSRRLYYYWVKNSVVVPAVEGRKISTAEIALYILTPASSGMPFVSFISSSRILAFNFENYLPSNESLLNIKFYKNTDAINLVHNEYMLLTEGDASSVPNRALEDKWIDSLIGYDSIGNKVPNPDLAPKQRYGISYRPRQSMFVNRTEALKIFVTDINTILKTQPFAETLDFTNLNSVDEIPNKALNLYDIQLQTYAELSTLNVARIKPAVLRANLIDGVISSVDIVDAGFGYRVTPPIIVVGTGTGAKLTAVIDNQGKIINVIINNPGRKYDNAILNVRAFSVLIRTDETYNNYWSIYQFNDRNKTFFRSLTQEFDTRRYWSFINWWKDGYSSTSRSVAEIPGLYFEPQLVGTQLLKINDLVRVKDYGSGGWAVLRLIDPEAVDIQTKYEVVGRESGTIEISSLIYDDLRNQIGYDAVGTYDLTSYDNQPVNETRNIIRAVKDDILINELKSFWNKLFFNSIHYIFSEQLYVDWAFKTSFLNAIHKIGNLEQKTHYKNDNLESYEQYLREVKPYRTKIRKFTSSYEGFDDTNTAVSDFDVPPFYSTIEGKLLPVESNNEILNLYPWKFWTDNNTYKLVEINVYDAGDQYVNIPTVVITGGGGKGAKAQAYVSSGEVTGIVVTNQGTGYTSAPTVLLVGGFLDGGREAKAVAFIGNSPVRSFDITLKFDRTSKEGNYQKFAQNETIVASGLTSIYELKYPPSRDKSKIFITINNALVLSNEYEITLYEKEIDEFNYLQGRIQFNSLPPVGAIIKIDYDKNENILGSVDRIDKFYRANDGMIGKDPKQLMTGLDFGGVLIQGSSFNSTGGWDALPWFSDSWDSVSPNSDYYIIADGSTSRITLPYVPTVGQAINVYIKRGDYSTLPDKTGRFTRIDDPYFNVYDGSTVQPNGRTTALPNAVMNTFVGNGITKDVELPIILSIQAGDVMIFRPSDSDGSLQITDLNVQDTNISGGTLANINNLYTTATGKTTEEIVLMGDKFISPTQVPAPEENVPGQVLDSVSIKVFQRVGTGAAQVRSKIYRTDGVRRFYSIGNRVLESKSVVVYLDKIKQTVSLNQYGTDGDCWLNLIDNQIEFRSVPALGKVLEIVAIGPGGYQILDFEEFEGDGTTRLFLTSAKFPDTRYVVVTINGIQVPGVFVSSKGLLNDKDNTLIEFGVPPAFRDAIKILVLGDTIESDSSGQNVVRINEQEIIYDGSTKIYNLDRFVNLERSSAVGNTLVEVNGKLIDSSDALFFEYDGSNNQILVGQDPTFNPGSIDINSVKVWVNEIPLEFIRQWTFNGVTNILSVDASYLTIGDQVRIEVEKNIDYKISGNNIEFLNSLALVANDVIKVTWFSEYPTMSIIKDRFPGNRGVFPLRRQVEDFSSVWVYKNGDRLTPGVDYDIDANFSFLKLKNLALVTDTIVLVLFGKESYQDPIAYEIFKDMLNSTYYKRYSLGGIKLAADLNYYDTEIVVDDASSLIEPDILNRISGQVTINNERIEYYTKRGNVLGQLTRGILGTATATIHRRNSDVVDSSITESLPYREYQEKQEFVSDGSTLLIGPLEKIPVKTSISNWFRSTIPDNFGPSNEYEVFVNGVRLRKNPYKQYEEELGQYSPNADIDVEAEFSVNGSTAQIRLTKPVPAGTKIIVIGKTGRVFYSSGNTTASSGKSLIFDESVIATFLRNKRTKLPE